MPFYIIRNDITKLETDAIVNAANQKLLPGGGVCGAIFKAAGEQELSEACRKIGRCDTGEAVITEGFRLKAKFIIHTVGPIYGKDPVEEEKQLYFCYRNSLNLAKENNAKSIAFPLISSGIYGYPKSEAIRVARIAIKEFLQNNEMEVYLVVYDKESFQISETLYRNVRSYIEERMVAEDEHRIMPEEYYDDICCSASFGASPAYPSMPVFEEKKTIEELIGDEHETFSQMLLRMIDEKGMSDVEVYKRANIDRKLFSKIRKKEYIPKKITVIALVIALKLNMPEAKALLSKAGYAFSDGIKFDLIIEFFIENGIYDIYTINETLFDFNQQLLGA